MNSFPREMRHGSGVMMTLEPGRLLIALKEEMPRTEVEGRLEKVGFMLEDGGEDQDKRPRPVEETVNHTETRFWVRIKPGVPVEDGLHEKLASAFEGNLDWIGPVYNLVNSRGRDGMLCPIPNVIVVRTATQLGREDERELARILRALGLVEVPEKSKYLGGYRYFTIPDLSKGNAYDLREMLLKESSRLVRDVRFENMPMLLDYCVSPNDPLFPQQWGMTQIQAGGAGVTGWDITTGVNTVVVAVLDSGCDLTHPDVVYSPLSINLGSMTPGSGGPVGGSGHGTSCAGIVSARFNNALGVAGVAGGCVIMALARQNSSDVEVAAGLNYAAANGVRVVSMSFGRYAPGEGFGPTGWDFTLIDPAIANAVNVNGLVLCAATGNEDTGTVNRYPARHALVIACGASDQADNRKTTTSPDGENWWGSNFGTNVHLGVNTGVDVVAPGVLIPTIDIQGTGGYNTSAGVAGDYVMNFNGTSSATPHVAGMAGLLFSQYPALTGVQVRSIIERTAQKVGAVAYTDAAGFPNGTRNQQMGYGRINVFRSLDFADAVIKDYPGDTGVEPSTPPGGNFWTFSDVVVRINDDNVFVPDDPSKSSNVERGQTNYIYVRVTNNGPRPATNVVVSTRITPFVGLEFVYPSDWTLVDAMHVSPTPVTASFASIPAGGTAMAKFTVTSAQVETLWGWVSGMSWHPCLLAVVTADNDYAFTTASTSGGVMTLRRNNLAQRNLSVIDVLADEAATFPFLAGHLLNVERIMEIFIDRRRLPAGMPLFLSLDEDGSAFPQVDLEPVVHPTRDDDCGIVFLDRTRIVTTLGCCRGVLTVEKGSRFECARVAGLKVVSVKGGEVIVRGGRQLVEIRGETAMIRVEKEPNQLYPLAFHTTIPGNAGKGDAFQVDVAQRNEAGETVGGATVVYMVA